MAPSESRLVSNRNDLLKCHGTVHGWKDTKISGWVYSSARGHEHHIARATALNTPATFTIRAIVFRKGRRTFGACG